MSWSAPLSSSKQTSRRSGERERAGATVSLARQPPVTCVRTGVRASCSHPNGEEEKGKTEKFATPIFPGVPWPLANPWCQTLQ
jgi:hypothetical protein